MANPGLSDDELQRTVEATWQAVQAGHLPGDRYSCFRVARENLGIPDSTLRHRLKLARDKGYPIPSIQDYSVPPPFQISHPQDELRPVEELIAERKARFGRKDAHMRERHLIPCKVNLEGPVGLMIFGDPHVDDDGTDIGLLERHMEIVNQTEGVFAVSIGDNSNNWVGRLGRLYAEQSTSAQESWQLCEWFVRGVKDWLFRVGGNHDAWSGAGDPIQWIKRQHVLYQNSECRMQLELPNDLKIRINARHDFSGSSQWNPAHGPMKAFDMGTRDHVMVCGHKHKCGYAPLRDPATGLIGHAIQVGSYKRWDRFALEKGFRDQHISPCAFLLIDPDLPDTHGDMIKLYWDPEEGAEVLKWKRSKA